MNTLMHRLARFALPIVVIATAATAQVERRPAPNPKPAQVPAAKLPPLVGVAHLSLAFTKASFEAEVGGVEQAFAIVFVSTSPKAIAIDGLPLLMADFVEVGAGKTGGGAFHLSLPCKPEMQVPIWGQAVLLDREGMHLSAIVHLKPQG